MTVRRSLLLRAALFLKSRTFWEYLAEIALIIVSILLAQRFDRWREQAKDRDKLGEYLRAIDEDLTDEIKTDEMNLRDAGRDDEGILDALSWHSRGMSSGDSSVMAFAGVAFRGVFRAFPPTAFDMMAESGDINLLKNLKLRAELANVFAFRKNVVQADLAAYDAETSRTVEKIGRFLNLAPFYAENATKLWIDKKAYFASERNELVMLLRNIQLRQFHLKTAIEDLKTAQSHLREEMKKLNIE